MIQPLIRLLAAAALLLTTTMSAAETLQPKASTVSSKISALMQEQQIPGVAVLLYVDGKPQSYYFGMADVDKKIPVTKNTIFEIGSLTKLMTSLLLAEQIDTGKMTLTTPVKQYLPALPKAYDDVNMLDLATHTAGTPFLLPDNVTTQEALQHYLENHELAYIPGRQYFYSNIGMGLLGMTLEKATGKSINQLYHERILAPLHMQLIGVEVPAKLMKFYAQGYDKQGKAVPHSAPSLLPSAGAMKASADDMQKFLSAALGLSGTPQKILYPMLMTESAYLDFPDFYQGLGWQIHTMHPGEIAGLLDVPEEMNRGPLPIEGVLDKPKYDVNNLIDKTGGTDGFRAYIALIPNKKSGIVILSNKFISNRAIVTAGREILFELNNIKPAPAQPAENA